MSLAGNVFLAAGAFLIGTAAFGMLRLPDVYNRTNAVAKAATLGVTLVLVGVGFHLPSVGTIITIVLAIAAQLFTMTVAGYALGRAAYRSGAPMVDITHRDDLAKLGDPYPRREEQ